MNPMGTQEYWHGVDTGSGSVPDLLWTWNPGMPPITLIPHLPPPQFIMQSGLRIYTRLLYFMFEFFGGV